MTVDDVVGPINRRRVERKLSLVVRMEALADRAQVVIAKPAVEMRIRRIDLGEVNDLLDLPRDRCQLANTALRQAEAIQPFLVTRNRALL